MLSGCIAGTRSGTSVTRESKWGKNTGESYHQTNLPHVVDFMRCIQKNQDEFKKFMQDNTVVHTAATAKNYMNEEIVRTIAWPP